MRTNPSYPESLHSRRKLTPWLAGAVACISALTACNGNSVLETQLQVTVVGNGTVKTSEGQIQCTSAPTSWCTLDRMRFEDEAMHKPITTLTAIPDTDSVFVGWSGDCTGTEACSVDLSDHNKSVTATFLKVAHKSFSAVHSNGDLTITGTFNERVDLGSGNVTATGGVDIFLARISSITGTTPWSIGFGSTGTDRPASLTVNGSGNLVVTGYASGLIQFGGNTLDCTAQGGHFSATFAGADGSYITSSCLASSQ